MTQYIVGVLGVHEKIYESRSKCWCSSWHQLRIYLYWKQLL